MPGRVYMRCGTEFDRLPRPCARRMARLVEHAREEGAHVVCLTPDPLYGVTWHEFGTVEVRCYNIDASTKKPMLRADNGLVILPHYINAAFSLKVEDYVDLGSHGMFICSVTEARVINDKPTMTYDYYHKNVKPKPETEGKKGYVCKICGYVYEGETLPDDFICPLCKHGVADFEPIA